MKKKQDWRDTLIDLIEQEVELAGGGTTHKSGDCRMNDIIHFVEELIKKK